MMTHRSQDVSRSYLHGLTTQHGPSAGVILLTVPERDVSNSVCSLYLYFLRLFNLRLSID